MNCGSAVLTRSHSESSECPVWSVNSDCVEAGWRLRECSTLSMSSSIVELVCSDLLVQPIITVSTVDRVSKAQQQGFRVSWRSSFALSCSIQPQYRGGSFQLTFTSSSTTINHTQPAVNHSARFLFPAADHTHQGSYSCVYHVHVFSHNFSSESRRLSLAVSDPTVFFIRLLLLLLSLLLFTSLIWFSHKTARESASAGGRGGGAARRLQSRRRSRTLQVELQPTAMSTAGDVLEEPLSRSARNVRKL
ncbi:uncharacterized protein LOC103370161 [Stegastes partitus]|uniref:Uncharacterized protein LOC103370161 n=1 Tax=Stegastes partitus TaxID=144197 RepID=A0A9Y4NHF8_9TELE|nr:PREDICTED: uncharacterized protein LOC103370161 [Stegastes partitus]